MKSSLVCAAGSFDFFKMLSLVIDHQEPVVAQIGTTLRTDRHPGFRKITWIPLYLGVEKLAVRIRALEVECESGCLNGRLF